MLEYERKADGCLSSSQRPRTGSVTRDLRHVPHQETLGLVHDPGHYLVREMVRYPLPDGCGVCF